MIAGHYNDTGLLWKAFLGCFSGTDVMAACFNLETAVGREKDVQQDVVQTFVI